LKVRLSIEVLVYCCRHCASCGNISERTANCRTVSHQTAPCGKITETLSACWAGAHFSIFGNGTSKFDWIASQPNTKSWPERWPTFSEQLSARQTFRFNFQFQFL